MKLSNASRRTWVSAAVIAQLGILVVAVAAPLSARLRGSDYRLRVAPVDPVDPFRGAYVRLHYPDLDPASGIPLPAGERPRDTVFVSLTRDGDVWKGTSITRTRPASGPYLRCRTSGSALLHCGIDSWFLPEGQAARAGQAIVDGQAVAVVRIDGKGNAALMGVRLPG